MFDEKKINELLSGSNPKKQQKMPPKKLSQPKTVQTSVKQESKERSEEALTLHDITWGSTEQSSPPKVAPRKTVSPKREKKNALAHQEYLHEKKLSEDRLVRLRKAESRIEELQKQLRTQQEAYTLELGKQAIEVAQSDKEERESLTRTLLELQKRVAQQDEQLEELQEKYQQEVSNAHIQNEKKETKKEVLSQSLVQVLQDHGIHNEEYEQVFSWLIDTGIFPLSYLKTDHGMLLRQILHDKCHLQAENIPIPKESSDLYLDVSLERCPLSGGENIVDLSRLIKDECLIHGYTKIVIFGAQGRYERLLQILFAHHALQVTLSPRYLEMEPEQAQQQIDDNQLAFSWGEEVSSTQVFSSCKPTMGEFLNQLLHHLRTTL